MLNRERTFADNFSDLIAASGQNYEQLSKALGISKTTVSYYANNRRKPSGDTAARIAKYFGISTDDLLGVKRTHGSEFETRGKRRSISIDTDHRGFVDLLDSKAIFPLVDLLDKYSAAVVAEEIKPLTEKKRTNDGSILDGYDDAAVNAVCEVLQDDTEQVHEYTTLNQRLSDPQTAEDKTLCSVLPVTVSKALEDKAVDIILQLLQEVRRRYTLTDKNT